MRPRTQAIVTLLAVAGCGPSSSFDLVCEPGPSVSGSPSPLATAGREYGACFHTTYISSWILPIPVSGLELTRGPSGARVSGGCVEWTPSVSDAGATRSFAVSTPEDACGGRARTSWSVRVLPPLVLSVALERAAVRPGERATVTAEFAGGQASWDFGPLASGVPATTPPLSQTTSLSIRAWNEAGAEERWTRTVQVLTDATIQSFQASAYVVTAGDPVYLSWQASGAAEYAVRANGDAPISTTASGITLRPLVDTTYALEARNALGAASAQLTVHVVPAPRILSLGANPPSVPLGGSTILTPVFENGTATLRHSAGLVGVGTVASTEDLGSVASGIPFAGAAQLGTDTYELVVTNPLGSVAVARVVVPAVGPGTFAYAGTPSTERAYGPAVLSAGDGVLLVGGDRELPGWNGTAAVATVTPDAWSYGPALQLRSERLWGGAARLTDGRVLVAGGDDLNGATWYEAELIDLGARTTAGVGGWFWSRLARPSVVPLDRGAAFVVGLSTPRLFDPATTTLVEVGTAVLPGTVADIPGPNARACRLAGGRVLATGTSTYFDAQPRAWLFDPESASLVLTGAPARYRSQPVVLCLRGGGALVAGGLDVLGRVVHAIELYDEGTGTFRDLRELDDWVRGAIELLDGRVLLVGVSPLLMDLATNTIQMAGRPIFWWSFGGNPPGLALLPDGRVVIASSGVPAPEIFTP